MTGDLREGQAPGASEDPSRTEPTGILVAVPDEAMRARLDALLSSGEGWHIDPQRAETGRYDTPHGVEIVVWVAGDEPLDRVIDLLVLPYVAGYDYLPGLAGSVRVIQSQLLGYDGAAELLPADITFCNAVGVHEAPTAEVAMALLLASQRGWPELARQQFAGEWHREFQPGLIGKRVLLIGVGGIGGAFEKRIAGFDAILTKVARTARYGIHSIDELPVLLPGADIVVLAVPLSDETRGMVDAAFLDRLPAGALVVNVSRGPIIDTDALVERVRTGAVRAALDVFDPEPLPAGHPLWSLAGSLVSPHLGGNVQSMSDRIDPLVADQISRIAAGQTPNHIVLPATPAAT
jgi:phosphoglycerate dehydrogenase-like enzyme